MAFSEKTKDGAYSRAAGCCERCGLRCNRTPGLLSSLTYGGTDAFSYPDFHFHHRTSVDVGGSDALSNCEFLCVACHINTRSYGVGSI